MKCKDCQTETIGPFCHTCGQKVLDRFSFRTVASWVADDLFVLDKGFFFTLKELAIRPSTATNNYISGITKRYYNPYKLVLIVTTIPFLIISLLPGYKALPGNMELLADWPRPFTSESVGYFFQKFPFFVSANFLAYFLFTIPFWALFSWLVFRKRQLNYVEHLIHVSYLSVGFGIIITLTGLVFASLWYLIVITFDVVNTDYLTFVLLLLTLCLCIVYSLNAVRTFYGETYLLVILKGLFILYVGVIVSMTVQFLFLSLLKAVSVHLL